MVKYSKFLSYLKIKYGYLISIKNKYFVIRIPDINYHITIFRDQWNDYQKITGKPYHLFHISSNKEYNKCSSYFWVDKYSYRIKKIPRKYFLYKRPSHSFYSSTRNPCQLKSINILLKIFQKILLNFRETLLK